MYLLLELGPNRSGRAGARLKPALAKNRPIDRPQLDLAGNFPGIFGVSNGPESAIGWRAWAAVRRPGAGLSARWYRRSVAYRTNVASDRRRPQVEPMVPRAKLRLLLFRKSACRGSVPILCASWRASPPAKNHGRFRRMGLRPQRGGRHPARGADRGGVVLAQKRPRLVAVQGILQCWRGPRPTIPC